MELLLVHGKCNNTFLSITPTPDNFKDFPEKEDLEGLFKQLLKPAKTSGGGSNALLQEVATFVIPAKLMICLHGVQIIVLYYKMVGRTIEPGDLL